MNTIDKIITVARSRMLFHIERPVVSPEATEHSRSAELSEISHLYQYRFFTSFKMTINIILAPL